MNKKIEEQRFEFILYINKHIICQRFFNIRDYNPDVLQSEEMKTLMDHIAGVNNYHFGLIPQHLKRKSVDFLWENYNPFFEQTDIGEGKNNFDKEDIFDFVIRVDKEVVAQSTFSGNLFPQKVRYAVDIKDLIPTIIADIRYFFSLKTYGLVTAA